MIPSPYNIASAIGRMGAVEVSPGRYAWSAPFGPKGYLIGRIREDGSVADVVAAPSWWSPKHQFAVRFPDGRVATPALTLDRTRMDARILGATAITTNFETGAEVPA